MSKSVKMWAVFSDGVGSDGSTHRTRQGAWASLCKHNNMTQSEESIKVCEQQGFSVKRVTVTEGWRGS